MWLCLFMLHEIFQAFDIFFKAAFCWKYYYLLTFVQNFKLLGVEFNIKNQWIENFLNIVNFHLVPQYNMLPVSP